MTQLKYGVLIRTVARNDEGQIVAVTQNVVNCESEEDATALMDDINSTINDSEYNPLINSEHGVDTEAQLIRTVAAEEDDE